MAYTAWSVVFGEQPSAAKWNILGANDASFNDGTGIADGAVTPAKVGLTVAFRATSTQSIPSSAASTDVTTYTEVFDYGSNFNHTTGIFTAPVSGFYMFVGNIIFGNVGGANVRMSCTITTSKGLGLQYAHPILNTHDPGMNVALPIYLDANDTAKMAAMQDSGSSQVMESSTFFSGYLIAAF